MSVITKKQALEAFRQCQIEAAVFLGCEPVAYDTLANRTMLAFIEQDTTTEDLEEDRAIEQVRRLTSPFRGSTNEFLRRELGEEAWKALWGPYLEKIGEAIDMLRAQAMEAGRVEESFTIDLKNNRLQEMLAQARKDGKLASERMLLTIAQAAQTLVTSWRDAQYLDDPPRDDPDFERLVLALEVHRKEIG